MRGLVLNFASTHQTENPRGFSEEGENKQLLIAIVVKRFYSFSNTPRAVKYPFFCSVNSFSTLSPFRPFHFCPFLLGQICISGDSIFYLPHYRINIV
ncbi:hypothetical protein FNB79_09785 [Formosa sediminum]|uniref:Uncharacterized protein n=1 Tax=Formosa sediminum TaxID=2594004 RepID=A0A516GRV4_9FLAO|nr:hypothetical protein FNB79_09785 [Formosa sediminum]